MIISRIGKALLVCGMSMLAIGCDKNDDDSLQVATDDPIVAGKGGPATLYVIPQHNGFDIDSCRIYVKYNTSTKPLNNVYDDSADVEMVNGRPTARFWYLNKGSYFIYGKGYNIWTSEVIMGGTPYKIITQSDGLNIVNLPIEVGGK